LIVLRVVIRSPFYDKTWHSLIPVTLGFDRCLSSPCVYHQTERVEGLNLSPSLRRKFQTIRSILILFYSLSAFLAVIEVLVQLLKKDRESGCYRYIYPLSTCCLIVSSCIYFPFMVVHMNGGYFREGSMYLLATTSFAMSCCSLYFIESPPSAYSPIP
jgi:hypothetical protein